MENERFNVLKNQGYKFEHNYGHGEQFLSSTLAGLMMLAFLVDQIQEQACRVFQQARKSRGTKKTLWMQMRVMMTTFRIPDWQTYMALLILDNKLWSHGDHSLSVLASILSGY